MEITLNNKTYKIDGNTVTAPNGKRVRVTRCDDTMPAHIARRLNGVTIPADYVWGGSAMLPRVVAEAALDAAKADMIDGLDVVTAAYARYNSAVDAYRRSMECEHKSAVAVEPSTGEIERAEAQYPIAALYYVASSWAHAVNVDKAAAGRAAMAAIKADRTPAGAASAIKAMRDEFSAAANAAVDIG